MRELGPVVTALLFAGRAGTSLTAEIGLMKAGEQLAAMEVMAVDPPARRVLVPRCRAAMIAMPVLAAVFSMVPGILGGWVVGVLLIGGATPGPSGRRCRAASTSGPTWPTACSRASVFGVLVTLVALCEGWQAGATPEGVARATTRTVVVGSLGGAGARLPAERMMFGN